MRWRLILVASLLAAISGTLAIWATSRLAFPHITTLSDISEGKAGLPFLLTLIVPLAANTYAAIFVYRHTARHRTVQAVLCVSLALVSCIALTIAAFYYLPTFPPR